MRIHFETAEIDKLAADLAAAAPKAARRASRALEKTANDIEGDAKLFAPVDTGNLKNSISSDIYGSTALIGPTANYGHYLEYGTDGPYTIPNAWGRGVAVIHPGIAPQPFMGPAFDRRVPGFEAAIGRVAEDIL